MRTSADVENYPLPAPRLAGASPSHDGRRNPVRLHGGLDGEVGTPEVGKRADLILIRTAEPNMSPVLDPVTTVVLQAGSGDVELVMVDGRIVQRDGRLVVADQRDLASRLQAAADRILAVATEEHLDEAYDYVRASFPLDNASALGARVVRKALPVRGLDDKMFRLMLAQSTKGRRPAVEGRSST